MIQSHYSLNVSLNGHHFCRCDLGTHEEEAKGKAKVIASSLGFKFVCELTYVKCTGHTVEFDT